MTANGLTRTLALLVLSGSWALPLLPQQPVADPDAKTLFYNPETNQAFQGPGTDEPSNRKKVASPKPSTALAYWVNLVSDRDRSGQRVAADRVFTSGESIQLVVESNFDGYLAVLSMAPDGSAELLFPHPGLGLTSNSVRARQPTVIPGPAHFFRFEGAIGRERLFVIVAPTQGDMEQLRLKPRVEPQQLAALTETAEAQQGAKSLVTAAFSDSPAGGASHVANLAGGTILLTLDLEHR